MTKIEPSPEALETLMSLAASGAVLNAEQTRAVLAELVRRSQGAALARATDDLMRDSVSVKDIILRDLHNAARASANSIDRNMFRKLAR